jgi:hypothetical protein
MTTKYLDGVHITERRADITPRLIGSVNYNEFTANATFYKSYTGILNRLATKRTLIFQSTLNQPLSSNITIVPFESTLTGFSGLKNSVASSSNGNLIASGQLTVTSDTQGMLSAANDSYSIGLPMGATVPTSGKIDIYLLEGF